MAFYGGLYLLFFFIALGAHGGDSKFKRAWEGRNRFMGFFLFGFTPCLMCFAALLVNVSPLIPTAPLQWMLSATSLLLVLETMAFVNMGVSMGMAALVLLVGIVANSSIVFAMGALTFVVSLCLLLYDVIHSHLVAAIAMALVALAGSVVAYKIHGHRSMVRWLVVKKLLQILHGPVFRFASSVDEVADMNLESRQALVVAVSA